MTTLREGKGERVTGLTGDLVLHPVAHKLNVALDAQTAEPGGRWIKHPVNVRIAAGEVVYGLHEVGEGYTAIWWKGHVYTVGEADTEHGAKEIEAITRELDPAPAWWLKVRSPSGQIGWTKDDTAFGDMDACG